MAALALALALNVTGPALRVPAASAGQPTTSSFTYWGSFFGGGPAGDTVDSPKTVSLPGPVVQVATSNSTIYALLADGTVYAWGLGDDGQLGDGGTANAFTTPVEVKFPAGVTISFLPTDVMPYNTALAVDTTGQAWGWGLDGAGQLCLGHPKEFLTPVKLPFAGVLSLAGAGDHALYDQDGTVFACGKNSNGDLGIGSTTPSFVPAPVHGLPQYEVKELVAGFNNSGALLDNGTYLDWGYDDQGQLGDGEIGTDSSSPVVVSLPKPVVEVAQSSSELDNGQTVVILSNGTVMGWGDNGDDQLVPKGPRIDPSPVVIAPPAGVTYAEVAAGAFTSYALSSAGEVYAWGGGSEGQLGNGGKGNASTPTPVEAGVTCISSTALDVATC